MKLLASLSQIIFAHPLYQCECAFPLSLFGAFFYYQGSFPFMIAFLLEEECPLNFNKANGAKKF